MQQFSHSNTYATKFDLALNIGPYQPRAIIYTIFVEFESPMLHTKFHDHRTTGSGDEGLTKVFYHIWEWQPSW